MRTISYGNLESPEPDVYIEIRNITIPGLYETEEIHSGRHKLFLVLDAKRSFVPGCLTDENGVSEYNYIMEDDAPVFGRPGVYSTRGCGTLVKPASRGTTLTFKAK